MHVGLETRTIHVTNELINKTEVHLLFLFCWFVFFFHSEWKKDPVTVKCLSQEVNAVTYTKKIWTWTGLRRTNYWTTALLSRFPKVSVWKMSNWFLMLWTVTTNYQLAIILITTNYLVFRKSVFKKWLPDFLCYDMLPPFSKGIQHTCGLKGNSGSLLRSSTANPHHPRHSCRFRWPFTWKQNNSWSNTVH